MKIEVIKNEKNHLEFYWNDEKHTLTNFLKDKLSQNENVEFCAYRLEHPLDKKARFVVKTKSESAKKAVEETIKTLQEDIAEFKKAFEKTK